MGNVFTQLQDKLAGGNKGPVVTDTDRAIVSIQRARRQLQDLKRRQDMLSERCFATVSSLLKEGKKDRARIALRTKKLHDKQALQLESNILLLDERMSALETSAQQAELLAALRKANGAIKAMQQQAPLEEVERLLDENAEGAQYVTQMNDLLAGSGEAAPEGELDAELLAMEADLLPSVPAAEPPAAEPQHAEVSTAPTDDEWPALALPAGGEPADGAAAAASDAALQEATTGSAAAGAGGQEQLGSIRDESLDGLPAAPTHKAEVAASSDSEERAAVPA